MCFIRLSVMLTSEDWKEGERREGGPGAEREGGKEGGREGGRDREREEVIYCI